MPRYIIHHDGAFNEYTTIADGACWKTAMTEADMKRVLGPDGSDERFQRAKETGCSGYGQTLDTCIAGNRAGDGEKNLTRDEFIQRFLTLPWQRRPHTEVCEK